MFFKIQVVYKKLQSSQTDLNIEDPLPATGYRSHCSYTYLIVYRSLQFGFVFIDEC